jgi:Domain of unknown function (DUF4136)
MATRIIRLGTLVLATVATACTTIAPTGEDYDHAVNFSGYSTFAFVQHQTPAIADPVVTSIENAIEADLTRRNYHLVSNPDMADFTVDFTLGAPGRPDSHSLSIDVLDQRSHKRIWHGWSKQDLPEADPTGSQEPLQQTVVAVLAWFPPGRLHP